MEQNNIISVARYLTDEANTVLLPLINPSELTVVAARPGMGKTTLAVSIARHYASQKQIPVAFFSLELSKEQLTQKFLCSENLSSLSKLYIDDAPGITVSEIHQKCREIKDTHNLGLVVMDCFQLISRGNENIQNTAAQLKDMTLDLCVPVIVTSQLSRSCEERRDHRPRMADFGESGALADIADNVVLLYREEYYRPDIGKPGCCESIITKSKNNKTGGTLNE